MSATLQRPADLAIGHAPSACHLFPLFGNAPFAHCGVPREEQDPHRIPDIWKTAPVCPVCGLQRCRICLAHHLRGD